MPWYAKHKQIELVDMTPEALRRRLVHGNVYAPEKVDAALGNYFRVGNLTALRELALLWVAGKVDEQLDQYRADHNIGSHWETRERVVVALTGGPEGETLIRRAARIAARTKGADLLAVHVPAVTVSAGGDPAHLAQSARAGGRPRRHLSPGGRDRHPRRALLAFARGVNATQLVLGASRRGAAGRNCSPRASALRRPRVRIDRRTSGHTRSDRTPLADWQGTRQTMASASGAGSALAAALPVSS